MKRVMAVVLAALLLAGPAAAQSTVGGDGKQVDNNSARVGGVDREVLDANGRPAQRTWTMDANGAGYVRIANGDRDYSALVNLFNGTNIAQFQTKQSVVKSVDKFSLMNLGINWGVPAVADTDSVAFVVTVYGLATSTTGNMLFWTPTPSDTCFANTTNAAADTLSPIHCLKRVTFLVNQKTAGGGGMKVGFSSKVIAGGSTAPASNIVILRRLTGWRPASGNGVLLDMTGFRYPYVMVEITNIGTVQMQNVVADIWPRVF